MIPQCSVGVKCTCHPSICSRHGVVKILTKGPTCGRWAVSYGIFFCILRRLAKSKWLWIKFSSVSHRMVVQNGMPEKKKETAEMRTFVHSGRTSRHKNEREKKKRETNTEEETKNKNENDDSIYTLCINALVNIMTCKGMLPFIYEIPTRQASGDKSDT